MSSRKLDPWRTVPEAAAETGIPAWRIKRLCYSRRIPFAKPEGEHGRLFVRASDVHAYMDSCTTQAK